MIFDGFLDRYPDLRLIAAHGGGTLPYLVGRFEKGDEVELPERRRMKARPIDYLRRIYYDCITYDLGALRYLVSVVGADRVMFGTDWPHQVHDIAGSLANTAALPGGPARRDPRRDGDEGLRVVAADAQASRVAARRSPTSRARPSTSRPSGPSASTSADATMTPSAPAAAMARTWAGRLTPKPDGDRDRRGGLDRRGPAGRPSAGSDVRAPVTPTSETQ